MARTGLFRTLRKLMRTSRRAQRAGLSEREYLQRVAELPSRKPRRTFLKGSALTLAASPIFQSLNMGQALAAGEESAKTQNVDGVLILGGGGAGLAAAFVLGRHGIPFTLVEGSQRLGGRIFTKDNFNDDGQFIEMGGELVDTGHSALFWLCEKLGLGVEKFSSEDASLGLAETLYKFNGQLFDQEDILHGIRPLVKSVVKAQDEMYTLKNGDGFDGYLTYKSAGRLPLFPKYDKMTLKDFLCNVEVAPWIREAVDVAYLGEYGLATDEQSALNLTELFDVDASDGFSMFGDSDEAYRVKNGSSEIPKAIIQYLTGSQNPRRGQQKFKIGHMLNSIKSLSNGKLRCAFDGPSGGVEMIASHVICTIPFSTLRNVELKNLAMSAVKKKCIAEIGYGTNSKVMLGFKSTFWRDGNLIKPTPASVGEFYGDFPSANFWETSRLQGDRNRRGILTNYLGGSEGLRAGLNVSGKEDHGARNREQALKDLNRIFGDIPKNQFTNRLAVANWSRISGGFQKGSYACLRPGQYGSIWGSAGEAELGGRLLFAGEHTSLDYQGYMNGAYDSGISAARQLIQAIQDGTKISSAS